MCYPECTAHRVGFNSSDNGQIGKKTMRRSHIRLDGNKRASATTANATMRKALHLAEGTYEANANIVSKTSKAFTTYLAITETNTKTNPNLKHHLRDATNQHWT